MADAVRTIVLHESPTHYVANFSNISDGTGEAAVIKVDKSAIAVASDNAEAGSLDIERVQYNCDGMTVRILWDHTTDDVALSLSGNGDLDFKGKSGDVNGFHKLSGLKDPRSTGGAGDILFTTVGHSAGDSYNITLWLRKNPA